MIQKLVKVTGSDKAKMLVPGKEYEVTEEIAANLTKKGEVAKPKSAKAE